MPAPVLHQAVVEDLGQAIASGDLAVGSVVRLDDVATRLEVTRSVAREGVRVLETLGMLAMKRRIGNVVQPRSRWRVLDPRVVRWRLASHHQGAELDSIMQLRAGVEPVAAREAAVRAAPEVGERLVELAARMTELGEVGLGRSQEFLAADIEFHRLLMAECGNDHIASLMDLFETLLTERNRLGILGDYPNPRAMAWHEAVAYAVTEHDPDAAEAAVRALVAVVHDEVLDI